MKEAVTEMGEKKMLLLVSAVECVELLGNQESNTEFSPLPAQVNGTLVTHSNHLEVVKLIKCK